MLTLWIHPFFRKQRPYQSLMSSAEQSLMEPVCRVSAWSSQQPSATKEQLPVSVQLSALETLQGVTLVAAASRPWQWAVPSALPAFPAWRTASAQLGCRLGGCGTRTWPPCSQEGVHRGQSLSLRVQSSRLLPAPAGCQSLPGQQLPSTCCSRPVFLQLCHQSRQWSHPLCCPVCSPATGLELQPGSVLEAAWVAIQPVYNSLNKTTKLPSLNFSLWYLTQDLGLLSLLAWVPTKQSLPFCYSVVCGPHVVQ